MWPIRRRLCALTERPQRAKSRRQHSLENGLLFGVERTSPLRMSACTLESGRISAWCRTSLPSQTRTRRKHPDQEIFQSTVSSKTPRGKYFSSHRPRHSKCFGRRLRRSVMVASVISAAVSWGCACQSSWGSEPSWIPPSSSLLVFSPRDLFYRVSRIRQTYLLRKPANVCSGSVRLNLQDVKTPMAGILRPSVHTTRPGRLRGSA